MSQMVNFVQCWTYCYSICVFSLFLVIFDLMIKLNLNSTFFVNTFFRFPFLEETGNASLSEKQKIAETDLPLKIRDF